MKLLLRKTKINRYFKVRANLKWCNLKNITIYIWFCLIHCDVFNINISFSLWWWWNWRRCSTARLYYRRCWAAFVSTLLGKCLLQSYSVLERSLMLGLLMTIQQPSWPNAILSPTISISVLFCLHCKLCHVLLLVYVSS